jgi:hypothetical protein
VGEAGLDRAPIGDPMKKKLMIVTTLGVIGAGGVWSSPGDHPASRPLTAAELEATRGGVVTAVSYPPANLVSYTQNVGLDADVANGLGQTTTTLYLHHGTTKTGYRTVATPAPGYEGSIQTRFSLLGGAAKDLVIKYVDPSNGQSYVSQVVPGQDLHTSVRLRKLVFHNVKTSSNQTTVPAATISNVVESRSWNWNLSTVASMDAILATCPQNKRTQVGFLGNDSPSILHTVNTGTNNCANLDDHLEYDEETEDLDHDATALACMEELSDARLALDPTNEALHFFFVKNLPTGLNGFLSVEAQALVISEAEMSGDAWWVASLLTHEMGHALGLSHTNVSCNNVTPDLRNLMCPGSAAGKLLTATQCDIIYDLPGLVDHN